MLRATPLGTHMRYHKLGSGVLGLARSRFGVCCITRLLPQLHRPHLAPVCRRLAMSKGNLGWPRPYRAGTLSDTIIPIPA